jgi:hypothetical protein
MSAVAPQQNTPTTWAENSWSHLADVEWNFGLAPLNPSDMTLDSSMHAVDAPAQGSFAPLLSQPSPLLRVPSTNPHSNINFAQTPNDGNRISI